MLSVATGVKYFSYVLILTRKYMYIEKSSAISFERGKINKRVFSESFSNLKLSKSFSKYFSRTRNAKVKDMCGQKVNVLWIISCRFWGINDFKFFSSFFRKKKIQDRTPNLSKKWNILYKMAWLKSIQCVAKNISEL